jgi:pimeloyl-ACP methyl ester carboxylesterase
MENARMGAESLADHLGVPLRHGRPTVNGVGLHYAIGGQGEPVYLVHGAPKSMFFWRRVIPLLTPHYTVVAVDLRGFGDSLRPPGGYDTRTLAADIAALATHLGHEQFRVAGEDWGAATAYAIAAFHRDRVRQLVFQEMRLPGRPVEALSGLAPDDPRTGWHANFFSVPHFPELLMAGREREFWGAFLKRATYDPSAITDEDIDEYAGWVARPGGLHALLSVYRAAPVDAEQNRGQEPLTVPVLAVGGAHYFGAGVAAQMRQVATTVRELIVPECGHNPPLEQPQFLAEAYLDFFAG